MTLWYEENLKNDTCYGMHKYVMFRDLQELYKKYLIGELGGEKEPEPDGEVKEATFSENFETSWVVESEEALVLKFNDTFGIDWFIINIYSIDIATENFDINWFTDNNYTIEITNENFEDESWD